MKNKYNVGDLIAIHRKSRPENISYILYIKSLTVSEKDSKTTYEVRDTIDDSLFGFETHETLDSFFTAGTFTIAYTHYKVVK